MDFSCPSCHAPNTIEAVSQSLSSNPNEAAQEVTNLPLKCAACGVVPPIGIRISVRVFPTSAYAEWIEKNRNNLHKHIDRSYQN